MAQWMAVILAAGAGTRMKSKKPKALHKICGQALVDHVIDAATQAGCDDIVVVTGHKREQVEAHLEKSSVRFAVQKERLGTGHAVKMATSLIDDTKNVLVLCADTPLLRSQTLKNLMKHMEKNDFDASLLTSVVDDPTGYGRILRNESGHVCAIVEHKDASDEQRQICEINPAVYGFKGKSLKGALLGLNNNNAQGEYYLTDTISLLREEGKMVGGYIEEDAKQTMGVNSRHQLHEAQRLMQQNIVNKLMDEGVSFVNKDQVYIEKNVSIGADTIVYPGAILCGKTSIGEDCIIGSNCRIEDSEIAQDVSIHSSTILRSVVEEKSNIGPYAYIRPNSHIGKSVKVGDFVEIKNARLGEGTKVSHLSYIGDGDVGEAVNIGCGTVFVNYDGDKKSRTIVEDGAFIGCNANLIAPVIVGKNAYVAAGSTITGNVPSEALSVARARQTNKEQWVNKRKAKQTKENEKKKGRDHHA